MGVDLPHWWYSVAWVFWLVWFLTWETLAVLDKGENETLSGHVKSLMWQGNGQPSVVAFVLLPFLVWLGWHFYVEISTRFTT